MPDILTPPAVDEGSGINAAIELTLKVTSFQNTVTQCYDRVRSILDCPDFQGVGQVESTDPFSYTYGGLVKDIPQNVPLQIIRETCAQESVKLTTMLASVASRPIHVLPSFRSAERPDARFERLQVEDPSSFGTDLVDLRAMERCSIALASFARFTLHATATPAISSSPSVSRLMAAPTFSLTRTTSAQTSTRITPFYSATRAQRQEKCTGCKRLIREGNCCFRVDREPTVGLVCFGCNSDIMPTICANHLNPNTCWVFVPVGA